MTAAATVDAGCFPPKKLVWIFAGFFACVLVLVPVLALTLVRELEPYDSPDVTDELRRRGPASSAGWGVCGASDVVVEDVVRVGERAGMVDDVDSVPTERPRVTGSNNGGGGGEVTVRVGRVVVRGDRGSLKSGGGDGGTEGNAGSGDSASFVRSTDALFGEAEFCLDTLGSGKRFASSNSLNCALTAAFFAVAAVVPAPCLSISPNSVASTTAPGPSPELHTGATALAFPRCVLRGDAGRGTSAGSTPLLLLTFAPAGRPFTDEPSRSSAWLGESGGGVCRSTIVGLRGDTGLPITTSGSSSSMCSRPRCESIELLSLAPPLEPTPFSTLRFSQSSRIRFASLDPVLSSLLLLSSMSTENRWSISASCWLMGIVSPLACRYRRGTRPRERSAASRCWAERNSFVCKGVGALTLGTGGRWSVPLRLGLLMGCFSVDALAGVPGAVDDEAAGDDVDWAAAGRSFVVMRLKRPALAGCVVVVVIVGTEEGEEGMVRASGT